VIKFYTDEHIAIAIAKGLRRRGINVITTQEAGMIGASDPEQLEFASKEKRTLFTQDTDFLKLHAAGTKHAGIVYSHQGTRLGYYPRTTVNL
jgi:predicted nuclease of predicted toxin-antitoxin system